MKSWGDIWLVIVQESVHVRVVVVTQSKNCRQTTIRGWSLLTVFAGSPRKWVITNLKPTAMAAGQIMHSNGRKISNKNVQSLRSQTHQEQGLCNSSDRMWITYVLCKQWGFRVGKSSPPHFPPFILHDRVWSVPVWCVHEPLSLYYNCVLEVCK